MCQLLLLSVNKWPSLLGCFEVEAITPIICFFHRVWRNSFGKLLIMGRAGKARESSK